MRCQRLDTRYEMPFLIPEHLKSGMSAIFYTIAAITRVGQNIVTGSNLYGGTHVLFENTLKFFDIFFVDHRLGTVIE